MEIRSYTELGAPKVGDGRIIEGYAVVFGQESRVLYDREKQRAFVEVIAVQVLCRLNLTTTD